MKHISDEDFMAKCKNIDFSADSQNYEANLDALKGKLAQANEGGYIMRKSRKFSVTVAAVLAAIMIPVAAFAAGPVWRYLEITFIQGEEHVTHFSMRVNDEENISISEIEMDRNAEGPIIAEVDGMRMLLQDTHRFYDLDEALSHLYVVDPKFPAYLPEGFAFDRAEFPVSPIRNPGAPGSTMLDIFYSDGQRELRFNIAHFPWGTSLNWADYLVDVDINGVTGRYGNGRLGLQFGNTAYLLHSVDLPLEQLIQIAKSLQ
ncbi:MAG: DUF4367 domain-containing protein [Clostridiales bacterium]|jgi:hypothetical protein|nr:DUF4367 domain-containing protein [Clostridiales bacterium]